MPLSCHLEASRRQHSGSLALAARVVDRIVTSFPGDFAGAMVYACSAKHAGCCGSRLSMSGPSDGKPEAMSLSDISTLTASMGFAERNDPFGLFGDWMKEAEKAEPNDPNAMALATVDDEGLPNVRMVLLKGFDDRGFVFYTNFESQKGQEILSTMKAALGFHWKSLRAVPSAGEPLRAGDGGRHEHRALCHRRGAAPSLLVGLPGQAAVHRVLARPAVPAA